MRKKGGLVISETPVRQATVVQNNRRRGSFASLPTLLGADRRGYKTPYIGTPPKGIYLKGGKRRAYPIRKQTYCQHGGDRPCRVRRGLFWPSSILPGTSSVVFVQRGDQSRIQIAVSSCGLTYCSNQNHVRCVNIGRCITFGIRCRFGWLMAPRNIFCFPSKVGLEKRQAIEAMSTCVLLLCRHIPGNRGRGGEGRGGGAFSSLVDSHRIVPL